MVRADDPGWRPPPICLAAHELRTPLALLKTEIELALRDDRTREELVAALRSAAEETDRLAELAESLLVIAGTDGSRLALARRPLQTDELLHGVSVRFGARAANHPGGGADVSIALPATAA